MQSDNPQSDDPAKLLTSQDVRPARPLIANQCACAPADQSLPRCHRYPAQRCPGECQYVLLAHECIHDACHGHP